MTAIKKQSYLERDFTSIRKDLIDILKIYYPDQFKDFNTVGPGMAMVDLLAFISDNLSFYIDKKFNEQFLDGLSERVSAYRLAKTFGFKPPGFRPAVSLCDISIEVPLTASGPDTSYLPLIRQGMQIKGGAQIFEIVDEVDFSNDFSVNGVANRKIEPIFNANQDILRYRILKREIIRAGTTKIFKKEIGESDANTPFLDITLSENNVLEVVSVIVKSGTGLINDPTFEEFSDFDSRYFEVDELAEDKVFLIDDTVPSVNGIKSGKQTNITRKFTKEFMADGTCKLTFGNGITNGDAYESYLSKIDIGEEGDIKLQNVFDNPILGERLPSNSTLYIKYRIGGGSNSNVGSNVLQQVGNVNAVILGSDATTNQSVISSIRANNVVPAIGGSNQLSVDEIKYLISSNFAAQKRCITLDDYISRAYQLPGKFGAPFRIHGVVDDNKIKLYILSKDANGKILTTSTNIIKNNIIDYLSAFRSVNDFVEINDGKVINISIETDLFVNKSFNANEVKVNAINAIKDFFDINKWQMNQRIYVSQITDILREVPGVINVVDIRIFNMNNGNYSDILISQATGDRTTADNGKTFKTQIDFVDNAVFSTPISIFEVRYPDSDILVRIS